MKTNKITIATIALLLMSVSLVCAFGVSSPYWDGNPLKMARGETKTVNLNLQNMVGDEDVTVKAVLVTGASITSLPEDTFVVEAGTADTMVPIKISIPKDAGVGDYGAVKIDFKTVQEDNSGITMGTGMTVYFDVVATSEVAETNTTMIIAVVIAIIVLVVIIWILLKKKRR